MSDPTPISSLALEVGTAVVTSTGTTIGSVEHVLQIPAEDLFDSIVVNTDQGLRFVDRDQISGITTAAVTCSLSDEQAAALPAPQGTQSFHVDPGQDSGSSLSARFGRLSGRER